MRTYGKSRRPSQAFTARVPRSTWVLGGGRGTGFSCALTFERDAWMGRMILALVVLPFSLSCATATLAPRKKPRPFEKLTLPAAGKLLTRAVWVTEEPAREQDP